MVRMLLSCTGHIPMKLALEKKIIRDGLAKTSKNIMVGMDHF